MNQDIARLLKAALECSVFINPGEPGLTYQELLEVGNRAGYQAGETSDAARNVGEQCFGKKYMLPGKHDRHEWPFYFSDEPEYRNFAAFDFVVSQLNDRVRADGFHNAQLQRGVMIERALAAGVARHDIELAIVYQLMIEHLVEENEVLRFPPSNRGVRQLPSQSSLRSHTRRSPERAIAYPIVKDLIERRSDGRPKHAEPLDAFAEQLDKLTLGKFRLWWMQTVGELRRSEPSSSPVAITVLAAALVEGALTFVVKHACGLHLDVFRSSDFDKEPRTWKIDDLIKSAATGGPSAILDLQTKYRAETLSKTRQRIHAGRMLSDYPTGVPDLRPEEAREAKETAEKVVRCVLDWLDKYPPST